MPDAVDEKDVGGETLLDASDLEPCPVCRGTGRQPYDPDGPRANGCEICNKTGHVRKDYAEAYRQRVSEPTHIPCHECGDTGFRRDGGGFCSSCELKR